MPASFTIGFSPCPNDTFIFDALVNQKIDTEGIIFDVHLEDVETLNNWALEGKLDITKLSFSTLFDVLEDYSLLNAGSALGKGCGPLLISRPGMLSATLNAQQLNKKMTEHSIAIPGIHTTANKLLSFALPAASNRIPMLFSQIEEAVLQGKADLGLIIHESRFTYQDKGLEKVMDLGEYWERQTGSPIPLGGIAIKKSIPQEMQLKVDRLIRKSLEHAFSQYPQLSSFITGHAQEMEERVMQQHIELYVNEYSLDLGKKGKQAICKMQEVSPGKKQFEPAEIFV